MNIRINKLYIQKISLKGGGFNFLTPAVASSDVRCIPDLDDEMVNVHATFDEQIPSRSQEY